MSSQTIDSKVVEMKFDNQQFEANVKTSLSTLDKLKQSLRFDGAEKGFVNVEKAASNISFEAMASGIESLEKRFSTFGIVGMRVIENLTDSAMRFATQTMGAVTNQIITGGKRRAFNIENAHFQLQGLLGDEEKVQAIMSDAMDSVDGTAYAYDEAAKAASQFAASGLQSGEEMMSALRGITGVAAMTNSEYEDISRVFTTVAGNGRLMGDQLLQLSGRGLNAASTLADYFNGIVDGSIEAKEEITDMVMEVTGGTKVVESDIRTMVSDGQIKFKMFAAAMDNAFGEHAKKANETFTGALSNVKAALSRIGAEFVSPLVVQNGALVKLFNALRVQINEVKKNIGPLASLFTDTVIRTAEIAAQYIEKLDFTKFFENFNKGVATIHNALKSPERIINAKDIFNLGMTEKQLSAFQKLLIETAKEHNIAIDEMIEQEGSFNATIKNGWLTGGILEEAYGKIAGLAAVEKKTVQNLDDVKEAALEVIRGRYGNDMEARFAQLAEEGFDPQVVQDYVNALHKAAGGTWNLTDAVFEAADAEMGNVTALVEMSDAELETLGYTEDEVKALRELKAQADETNTPLEDLISSFEKKPSGLELIIDSVQNTFGALGKVFQQVGKAWKNVFPAPTSDMIYGMIQRVHGFTEKLSISGSTAKKVRKTFQGLFSGVNLVGKVFSSLGKAVLPVFGNVLKGVGGEILNATSKLGDWLFNLNKSVTSSELFEKVMKPLGDRLQGVTDKVGAGYKQFKAWAKENQVLEKTFSFLQNGAVAFATGFGKSFENIKNRIKSTFASNEIFTGFYDRLKIFGDEVRTAFDEKGVLGVFGIFKERLKKLFGSNDFLEGVKNQISGFWGTIKTSFSENGIRGVFDTVRSALKEAFDKVVNYFTSGQAKADLFRAFDVIKNGFLTFKDWLVEKLNLAGDGVGSFKDKLLNFASTVKEKFSNAVDWSSIINYIGMFAGVFLAFKTIKGVLGVVKNLKSIGNLINSIAAEKKANAFAAKAKAIRNIAISIGILAAAVFVLGNMDRNKLLQGAIALGGLMAAFAILSVVLSKAGSVEIKAGGTILAFAVSLVLLVHTLKQLQKMDLEGVDSSLALLGGLILSMVLVSYAMSKMNLRGSVGTAATLLAFAVSINLLVGAFAKINKMDLTNADKSLLVLGGLMLTLAMVAKACDGIKMGSGVGLLAIVVSLNMMIGVMKKLAKMKISTIAKSIPGLIVLMGMVSALMLASKLAGQNAAKGGAAILMISVALNLLVFAVKALGKMDASEATKGVLTMLGLMAGISLMMAATGKAGKESIKAGLTMVIIAGVLTALAFVIRMLADVDAGGLARATLALSALMGMMGLMILFTRAIKTVQGEKISVAPILALAVAVGALAGSLWLLSGVDSSQLEGATKSLLLMMGAFTILGLFTKKFASGSPGMLLGLAGLVAVVGALAGIFYLIRDLDAGNMLTQSQALSLAIVSIGGVCAVLSAVHADALSGLGAGLSFDAFILTVGAFGALLGAINDLTGGGLAESVEAGIPVLEAVGGLIGGFVHGIVDQFADEEDSKLSTIGDGLTSFMSSISSFLDEAEGKEESFSVLGSLADAILKITAAEVLDGIASWITGSSNISSFADSLPQLGEAMTSYADSLGDSLLNEDKITASENLASMMATLYGSNELKSGGLIGAITGDSIGLDSLGEQLVPLAEGLSSYASLIDSTTFDDTKITASTNLVGLFSTLYGADELKEGGLIGAITGDSIGLDSLGEQLPVLAEGLAAYANAIDTTTFDDTKITASTNLASLMATLYGADELKEGGLIGAITGSSIGLDTLGDQLVSLATGLSGYAAVIDEATFNEDKITASDNLAKLLASLYGAEELKSGGLIGAITGDSIGLDTFGDQLVSFATGMKSYADAISGMEVTDEDVKMSEKIANLMLSLAGDENMPTSGGLFGWMKEQTDMEKFAEQLPKLGEAISGYASALGTEISADQIDVAANAATMLADLQTAVSGANYGGIFTSSTLESFGKNIVTFGKKLKAFSEIDINTTKLASLTESASGLVSMGNRMKELDTSYVSAYGEILEQMTGWPWDTVASVNIEGVSDVIDQMSSIITTINSMGSVDSEAISGFENAISGIGSMDTSGVTNLASGLTGGLASGISDSSDGVTAAMSSVLTSLGEVIRSKYEIFQTRGRLLMTYLRNGMKSADLSNAFSTTMSTAVNSIRSYYDSFRSAGGYLALGLAAGINAQAAVAVAAATRMANAVASATRAASKIKSPSRVFYEIGSYMGQGLVNALDDYNDTVYDAGYDIADAARYGLSKAISKVSDLIENGMNTQPTIRPVLDLSNIESGAGQMEDLLSLQPSYAVAGNIGAISAGMSYRNQNVVSNSDIVSAIRGLQRAFGSSSGDTYNINGVTYDDGSNIRDAVRSLIHAAKVERRA